MATAVPETEHDPNYGEGQELKQENTDRIIKDGKIELQDADAWDKLGYSFPTWRKWQILGMYITLTLGSFCLRPLMSNPST